MVPGFWLCVGSWEPGNLTHWVSPWCLFPCYDPPWFPYAPGFCPFLSLPAPPTWLSNPSLHGPQSAPTGIQSFYHCQQEGVLPHLHLESCRSKLLQEDRCNSDDGSHSGLPTTIYFLFKLRLINITASQSTTVSNQHTTRYQTDHNKLGLLFSFIQHAES